MSKISKAVDLIKKIAADDTHGYSQKNRKGNPDFDCSSLVIHCLRAAGFDLDGASYTGDMLKPLKTAGFKDVTKSVDLKTGSGIIAGDVLLTPGKHVELCTGDGTLAGARGDENGGIEGKKKGDQTGREIAESKYYNYPWKYVLRYAAEEKPRDNIDALAVNCIYGKYGNGEDRRDALGKNYAAVQERVNKYYDIAADVIDGKYGNGNTRTEKLTKAGYNPAAVQFIVNRTLWRI